MNILKSSINHYPNMNYKKVADNIPDWKQMLLMASCDNFIIANSTFSWMGAYLAKKEKLCSSPRSTWFGPYYKNNKLHDLRPEDWILARGLRLINIINMSEFFVS